MRGGESREGMGAKEDAFVETLRRLAGFTSPLSLELLTSERTLGFLFLLRFLTLMSDVFCGLL